jgi:membrane-associated phospholipid phosphatase
MNTKVIHNYSRLKTTLLLWPLLTLLTIGFFLYSQQALDTQGYIRIQQDLFYRINETLGQFPNIQFNLTQFGDALIFMSLLSLFILYAPAMWHALISASLFSLIASSGLKNLFSIPRPAAAFDANSFIIIGDKLPGHSSLPSGHSITIFTTLTILLFAFMPENTSRRLAWFFLTISIGFLLAFTRVGVGAHFPLDVIIGSIVGFICGLTGIFFSRSYPIWWWVGEKKYHPVFMLLLTTCIGILFMKTLENPLPIYCLTLAMLIFSLYKITHVYIQK